MLKSIVGLFDDLVKNDQMDFILSYRISQDHKEMFFQLFDLVVDSAITPRPVNLNQHTKGY